MAAFTINAERARVRARWHRRDDPASEIAHTAYRPDGHGQTKFRATRRGIPASSFEFGPSTGEPEMTPDP